MSSTSSRLVQVLHRERARRDLGDIFNGLSFEVHDQSCTRAGGIALVFDPTASHSALANPCLTGALRFRLLKRSRSLYRSKAKPASGSSARKCEENARSVRFSAGTSREVVSQNRHIFRRCFTPRRDATRRKPETPLTVWQRLLVAENDHGYLTRQAARTIRRAHGGLRGTYGRHDCAPGQNQLDC